MCTGVFKNVTPVGSLHNRLYIGRAGLPYLSHGDVSSLVYDATGDDWKCLSFDRNDDETVT